MAGIGLLPMTIHAQIKYAKTVTADVSGNCGMCEASIEKAGTNKKLYQTDWNVDTKVATITFDSTATNPDAVLKQIALSGYDNERFLAPDDAYEKLHGCCKYERTRKRMPLAQHMEKDAVNTLMQHQNHQAEANASAQEANPLKPVFENYFLLKDALVKSDAKKSALMAKELTTAIEAVDMQKLSMDVHVAWMKELSVLKAQSKGIAEAKDLSKQRDLFMNLSNSMYAISKVSKQELPVYYQYCPMANDNNGAYWLSKEKPIKNPYFGNAMLTCGKTVETIQ